MKKKGNLQSRYSWKMRAVATVLAFALLFSTSGMQTFAESIETEASTESQAPDQAEAEAARIAAESEAARVAAESEAAAKAAAESEAARIAAESEAAAKAAAESEAAAKAAAESEAAAKAAAESEAARIAAESEAASETARLAAESEAASEAAANAQNQGSTEAPATEAETQPAQTELQETLPQQTEVEDKETENKEKETEKETRPEKTTEKQTEAVRENTVRFDVAAGAKVYVDNLEIKDNKSIAKDGKIVFVVRVQEGYEIVQVLVDGTKDARRNDATGDPDDYIIEGIQTDSTVVTVKTQVKETEAAETETESETEAATEAAETEEMTGTAESETEAEETTEAESETEEATETESETETATEVPETESEEVGIAETVMLTVDLGGVTVSVNAADGVLPEGTQITAIPVAADTFMDVVSGQLYEENPSLVPCGDGVAAADITLLDKNGNMVQPEGSVMVTFNGLNVPEDADWARVYHIDGNGAASVVAEVAPAETVTFAASHFSTYAVVMGSTDGIMLMDALMPIAITGDNVVEVEKSIVLKGSAGTDHKWTPNNNNVTVNFDENTATVTGKQVGRVTITHTYKERWFSSSIERSETYDVRVVALGQKKGKVTYNVNSSNHGSGTAPDAEEVQAGTTITLPGQENMRPGSTNYVFVGWSTYAGAATASASSSTPERTTIYPAGFPYTVERDVTLYAIWAEKDITATFYVRLDGQIPKEPGAYLYGPYTSGITKADAIKEGYFYFNPQGVNAKLNQNQVPSDAEIKTDVERAGYTYTIGTDYVVWYVIKRHLNGWHVDGVLHTREKVSLTYDENVPSAYSAYVQGIPVSRQYDRNTEVEVEGTPTWPGHTFLGWSKTKNGPVNFNAGDKFKIEEDTVLYAIWDEVKSTVSVEKIWQDANDQDGFRPESVHVQLYQTVDGEKEAYGEAVELNADNSWKYEWSGLPQNDGKGNNYTYTVEESGVPEGYESETTNDGNSFTITNTHTTATLERGVTVTKEWVDANNQDSKRPTSVSVQLKKDGDPYGEAVTLNATNSWSYTWLNLPKNKAKTNAGEETVLAKYTVEETNVPASYQANVTGDVTTGFTVTNTYMTKTTEDEVKVTKVWADAGNQDGIRPENVTVQLQQNGKPYGEPMELNEGNGWSHNWNKLPAYVEKAEENASSPAVPAKYTIVESNVPEGYSSKTTNDGNSFTVTNTHTPDTLEKGVTVTKSWNDANNQDGIRPESVKVQLQQNDINYGDPVELNAENKWSHTWENLPEHVAGQVGADAVYTVVETEVPKGYTSDVTGNVTDGFMVTNTHTVNTLEKGVTVTKDWNDANNQDGIRPEKVSIQLQQNNKPYGDAVELNEDNGWSYIWEDLPVNVAKTVATEKTVAAEYTVAEPALPKSYTSEVTGDAESGFVVTNTHEPETLGTGVTVTKEWDDAENFMQKRPDSVKVQLYQNGVSYADEVELNAGNNWSYTWEGLPKYAKNQKRVEAEYTVDEIDIPDGYTPTVTGNVENGFTVKNRLEVNKLKATKELTNGTNKDGSERKFKTGETATFKIVVENIGNTVQENVVVTETMADAEIVAGDGYTVNADGTAMIPRIEAGKSVTVMAEYMVTQSDIDNQIKLANIATVNDEDTNSVPIPTVTQAPALTVVKTADKTSGAKLNDVITYTITVTNSGNVTVSDIMVTDEPTKLNKSVGALAPGKSASVTTTHMITEDDILAGSFVNTATATGTDPNGGEVTGSDDETVTTVAQAPALTVEKTADKTEGAALNDVITYTITVTNSGNVTVSDVTVTDPLTGLNRNIGSLAPGKVASVTTTYTVQEKDILAGSFVNTATAKGTDPNGGEVSDSGDETVTTAAQNPGLTVTKKVLGSNYGFDLDDTIRYHVSVQNTGNVTLTDVKVTDPLTGLDETIDSLAPGVKKDYYPTYKVQVEDIEAGTITNIANAVGTAPDGDQVEDSASVVVEAAKQAPALAVEKTADKTTDAELGDVITYTITVTNSGNVTVKDITVSDPLTGNEGENALFAGTLKPGESGTVTATYTVTEADILAGSFVNTAIATGTDPNGEEVTGSDDETVTTAEQNPALTVTKRALNKNFGYELGDKVQYSVTVTNTGNVTVSDITVTDPLTGDTWTINSLAPGAVSEKFITKEYSVTEDDIKAGKIKNTADAAGKAPNGAEVTGSDSVTVETVKVNPSSTVSKSVVNEGEAPFGWFDYVEYKLTVKNDGNVTLENETVEDTLAGIEVRSLPDGVTYNSSTKKFTIETLAPGATVEITYYYQVKESDLGTNGSGTIENTAKTGHGGEDTEIVQTEPLERKSKVVKKSSIPEGEKAALGQKITYTLTVTNEGTVPLENEKVTDTLAGIEVDEAELQRQGVTYDSAKNTFTILNLLPGEENAVTITYTYTVTEKDIIKKSIINTATTDNSGYDRETTLTDGAKPRLTVTKRIGLTNSGYDRGDVVNYHITVENTGNVTLKDVKVRDTLLPGATIVEGSGYWLDPAGRAVIGEMAPGAKVMVNASYTVTADDIDAGEFINTAEATGTAPDGTRTEGKDSVWASTAARNPKLEAEKTLTNAGTGKDGAFKAGETAEFAITVTNTGNVKQTNVKVTENLANATIVEGDGYTVNEDGQAVIAEIAPDESVTVKAQYTVTQEDIDSRAVLTNSATVDGEGPTPDPVEEIPKDAQNPGLRVEKRIRGNSNNGFDLDAEITYHVIVTNKGNVTLHDVTVTDKLDGATILPGEDYTINEAGQAVIGEIAPNERRDLTVTYTVTEDDIHAGRIDNTADAEGYAPDGTKVTSSASVAAVPAEPKLALEAEKKLTNVGTAEGGAFKAGDMAEFDITVKNTGNVTQKEVTVTEQLTGAAIVAGEGYRVENGQAVITELAPDVTVVVKATYEVTQEDIDSDAVLKNVALVKGENGEDPDPTPEVEIPKEPKKPGLTAEKTLTNSGTGENGAFKANEKATFDITVTNSGNTTQKNVTVSEMAGAVIVAGEGYTIVNGRAVIAEMAPGATVVVKATYTVTQKDIDNEEPLKNIAKVKGDNGTVPDPEPEIPIPEVEREAGLNVNKTIASIAGVTRTNYVQKAGDEITYRVHIKNTGNVTLKDIAVKDDLDGIQLTKIINLPEGVNLLGGIKNPVIDSLAPGEEVVLEYKYTVTQADIDAGRILNIATATAANPVEPNSPLKAIDTALAGAEQNPGLTAEKSVTNAPEGGFKAGETATFDITVTNSGNTTQHGVTVSEDLVGATIVTGDGYSIEDGHAVIAEMAPGATVVVKAAYTVTQNDIDNGKQLKNIATVKGDNGTEPDPTPGTDIPKEEQKPDLEVTKGMLGSNYTSRAGETVRYIVHVKNTGNVTLTDIEVVDELPGVTLAKGMEKYQKEDRTVIESLAPGEEAAIVYEYTVTQADIDNESGSIVNTATATGNAPDNTKVSDEDSVTRDVEQKPSLRTTKTLTNEGTGEGGRFRVNDTATFDIVVRNTGNTTQNNVTVKEGLENATIETDEIVKPDGATVTVAEDGKSAEISDLAPDESVTLRAQYTVTQADIDSIEPLQNTLTVDGDGTTTGPDPVPIPEIPQSKSLSAVKTVTNAPEGGFKAGETAEFAITVTNTGNTTQKNVVVKEGLEKATIAAGDGYTINEDGQAVIAEIAPNATVTVKATYEVTQADIDSDDILKNFATIDGGDPTDPVPDPEVVIPEEPKNPGLMAAKTVTNAPVGGFKAGETAEFDITVTNTGNTTQQNVVVEEQLPNAVIVEGTGYTIEDGRAVIESLAPNATVIVKATYEVTQADIDSDERLANIATVTGPDPTDPVPDPEVVIPEEPKKPALTTSKTLTNAGTGENGAFKAGETATFDITVTNSGNTTQTNVTVTEQLAGAVITAGEGYTVNAAGQAVIARMVPGATVVVKAAYTVTQADIDSDAALANVALVDGDTGTDPDPTPTEPIPEEEQKPGLTTSKTLTNAGTGANGAFRAGETATFDITVTNSGNTTQQSVVVSEQLAGAAIVAGEGYTVNANGQAVIPQMAPGATVVVKAAYTVTQADIDSRAALTNTALVDGDTGTDPDPTPTEPVPTEPKSGHLTVTKTITSTPAAADGRYVLGEAVSYQIVVTNDGNLTLANITVNDVMTRPDGTAVVPGEFAAAVVPIGSLAPGESRTLTYSHVVTAEDLGGNLTNAATATGAPTDPDPQNPAPNPQGGDETTVVTEDPSNSSVTVTKTAADILNGEAIALPNAQFQAALFADAGLTQRVGEIQTLSFGADGLAATATFSNLKRGTYYVAEVDANGAAVTQGEYQNGLFTPAYTNNGQAVIADNGGNATVSIVNNFSILPDQEYYYRTAYLTITKQVRDADGNSVNSDETFYAGVFADAAYTQFADNVQNTIVALNMGGKSSASATIEVTVPENGQTTLYVTEVTADGTPVENSASFAYDVAVDGAVVTLVQDASAETTIVNTMIGSAEEESGTDEESRTDTTQSDENSGSREHGKAEPTEDGVNRRAKSVKTGDETPVVFYSTMLFGAMLAMILIAFLRRRRRQWTE